MISANTRCLVFVSVFSFPRFISIFSVFESNLFRWPSVPFSSPYIIFSKFSTQLRPIVDETPKASRPLQPHATSALNESLHSTLQDVFCSEQFQPCAHSNAQTIRFCVSLRAMNFAAIRCILIFVHASLCFCVLVLPLRKDSSIFEMIQNRR